MNKKLLIPLQLAAVVLTTSCATILNPKMQKVVITTGKPDTKVYVNNQLAGKGNVVEAKFERNVKIKQIRTEAEGFKPEYRVHYQYKKSPLYILSWVPFGLLIYPPFYDFGPKAFDYDKTKTIKNDLAVSHKKENEKYMYLKNTAFSVKKEDLKYESYTAANFYKGKQTKISEQGKKDLTLNNTIFTDAINKTLKTYGYVDTTKTIFKDNTNSLYISADIKTVTFKDVSVSAGPFHQVFSVGETSIDWDIMDIYGQSKLKKTIKCQSGEFSPYFIEDKDDFIQAILEDAIATSFFKLVEMPAAKDLLNKGKDVKQEFEMITLARPAATINKLANAQNATVTLVTKEGHGSGCVISKDGYVVSNYHVIAGATKVEAVLNDGRKVPCTIVRFNEKSDLALLKMTEQFTDFYVLPDKQSYAIGDEVFAIGTPNSVELGNTLSKGIVSGVRKKEDLEWIQTDVSVNPGNSGGALVNKNGELVGIVNSKLIGFGVEGIAFCIPAQKLFKDLKLSYQ